MKGAIALRKPVAGSAVGLDTATTNITNAAYVQLVASTAQACSGVLVANAGAQPIGIAIGGAGSEKDTGAFIPPASSKIIPMEIPKGSRVALKSLGGTQSTGVLAFSLLV